MDNRLYDSDNVLRTFNVAHHCIKCDTSLLCLMLLQY
jgi:hypothetical protein